MSIDTCATPQGTSGYFQRHSLPISPVTLGRTGLQVSPVGFGGYRVDAGIPEHEEALTQALLSGCNLVDTSTNYTNGSSERLVGKVLMELHRQGIIRRQEVVVVTKIGYVQGENLALARERIAQGNPFPEMVEYADGCWHNISPAFLEDQLGRSLLRLGLPQVDFLLLHNPEYFLKTGAGASDHQEYYRRIRQAFEHLEKEVERGRIRYYGISSNTFPAPRESDEYTSLETVYEIAQSIRPDHHFALIQFPMNLFEPGAVLEENNSGKTVARFARERNLGTLINRPLNAITDRKMVRLADFPAHDDEDIVGNLKGSWNRAMELEAQYPKIGPDEPVPAARISWGHLMRQNFQYLTDLDTWKQVLNYQIEPSMDAAFAAIARDPAYSAWLTEFREVSNELFRAFTAYLESQASHESDRIASILNHAAPALRSSKTLSRKAIRIYRSFAGIDCVLLGMRKPEYVRDGLALEAPIPESEARAAIEALLSTEPATH